MVPRAWPQSTRQEPPRRWDAVSKDISGSKEAHAYGDRELYLQTTRKVSREQVEITDSESFRLDAKGTDFQDIAPILGSEGVIAPLELALSSATSALSPLRHQGSAGDLGL